MNILQRIQVKRVLTTEALEHIQESFDLKKKQLQMEIEQLKFQQKKQLHLSKQPEDKITTYFVNEIEKREEQLAIIVYEGDQLNILPLGSEIIEREVEALVPIKVGDQWSSIQTNKEIVIKDDIIIEIRTR
ncbi:YlqD family protein [Brochothrix thermosphacta]|uniref:YlqD family protein n=1 Tax=Brochothrix thermosphacta TaxID=2756 RepID=UPI0027136B1F|nr:YlqD family protein [Brochothrix thermosphacta]MDO7862942.1 YlqD family protein [Brochothrix thermosphacta]